MEQREEETMGGAQMVCENWVHWLLKWMPDWVWMGFGEEAVVLNVRGTEEILLRDGMREHPDERAFEHRSVLTPSQRALILRRHAALVQAGEGLRNAKSRLHVASDRGDRDRLRNRKADR